MSNEPGSLGKPTERDIKAAWMTTDRPSVRPVGTAMRVAGWDVSDSTIQRLVKAGFKPRSPVGRPDCGRKSKARMARDAADLASPEATIIKQVKAMAPDDAPPDAVADALVQAIRNLPEGAKDRVKALLDMDEQEMDTKKLKLLKVAGYLLAEDLAQHTKLMMLAPDKAAKLYQALGTSFVPVVQPAMPSAGEDAKIVNHDPNEPRRLSPSAQVIADFRAKRGSVAA